jgi:hypothetical protein
MSTLPDQLRGALGGVRPAGGHEDERATFGEGRRQ